MSAVQAFNNMMGMFLEELELAFPREKALSGIIAAFQLACKTNARLPVEAFMEAITPHVDAIMNKNAAVITDKTIGQIPYLKDINLEANWSGAPDATKEAIWQYLQTLVVLGIGVTEIPVDILTQAEEMAQNFAARIHENGEDPEKACMQLFSQMMGGAMQAFPQLEN